MKKIFNAFLALAMVITAGMTLTSCSVEDNSLPDNPITDETTQRVNTIKGKLQDSYLYYPIIVQDVMCGAFSFNLAPDGKASKMGLFTTPDWDKIEEDSELELDSCNITWDIVPNYEGFKDDELVGDALHITMKGDQNETRDIYYIIGALDNDSVKLLVPSQYGPQDFAMWRFDNKDGHTVTEMTGAISIFTSVFFNSLIEFVTENMQELSTMTDEKRMDFLEENGLKDLTDWIYDFDSEEASVRRATRAATRADEQYTTDFRNWMSHIRDDVKIRDMVIPGSHDAATFGISSLMKPFGLTQPNNLTQQWNDGARVFDLRPRAEMGTVKLFHNFIPCHMKFIEAVQEIAQCVKDHPTDGAILIVKPEDNDAGGTAAEVIKRIVQSSMTWLYSMDLFFSAYPFNEKSTMEKTNRILLNDFPLVDYRADMTMGELRGKILVIERSDADKSVTAGAYASGWGDNQTLTRSDGTESAVLRVQDHYGPEDDDTPIIYTDSKLRRFTWLWDDSEIATDKPTWYVNSASGYVWDTKPIPNYYRVAAELYPKYVEKITSHLGRGIILQDFTGVDRSKREYEGMVQTLAVIKHTVGQVIEVAGQVWDKTKKFATNVVNKVTDVASSVWNTISGWFSARSYEPSMLRAAPTRADDDHVYNVYGRELTKQSIYNNFRYGDRTK